MCRQKFIAETDTAYRSASKNPVPTLGKCKYVDGTRRSILDSFTGASIREL